MYCLLSWLGDAVGINCISSILSPSKEYMAKSTTTQSVKIQWNQAEKDSKQSVFNNHSAARLWLADINGGMSGRH